MFTTPRTRVHSLKELVRLDSEIKAAAYEYIQYRISYITSPAGQMTIQMGDVHVSDCFRRHKNKNGEVGGFVESTAFVSPTAHVASKAIVFHKSQILDNAKILGNARIYRDAQVSGEAMIAGNAWLSDYAKVYGQAKISGNASVSGSAEVYGNAKILGHTRIEGGAKVFGNTKISGFIYVGSVHIPFCSPVEINSDMHLKSRSDSWEDRFSINTLKDLKRLEKELRHR
ncbi:MAG: hypothetical protein KGH65_02415 [Candidatus Micrarchaeota archaeon]|nr:hypothetical protein [Candidatus Micrarchaeota archaeon]